ncbi:MAG: TIM44-like domain-containing protein [Thermoplasmata archaeon]|nr:TIM44-like domain-containing protein [Thermoplasmata archaeon]
MNYKLKRKLDQVDKALQIIGKNDPIWRKNYLLIIARHAFRKIQRAWSEKDRGALRALLTKDLCIKWEALLDKMDEVGQRNIVDRITIEEVLMIDVKDFTNDDLDRFTARIKASAVRYTVDTKNEWEEPKWDDDADPNPGMESKEFIEFWTFQRHGDSWRLTNVEKEWKEGDYTDTGPVLKDEKYMERVGKE